MKFFSTAEKQLMHALWYMGSSTLDGLVDSIDPKHELDHRTARICLEKMRKTGFVGCKLKKFKRCYYPLVDKTECMRNHLIYLTQKAFPKMSKELIMACLSPRMAMESAQRDLYKMVKNIYEEDDDVFAGYEEETVYNASGKRSQ